MTIHPTQQPHACAPNQRLYTLGDPFYPSFTGPVTVLDCVLEADAHTTLIAGSQVVPGENLIRPNSIFLVSEANDIPFESWRRLNEEMCVATVAEARTALRNSRYEPPVPGVDLDFRYDKPAKTLQAQLNHWA